MIFLRRRRQLNNRVVENCRCRLGVFCSGGRIAVDDPQEVWIVLDEELERNRLAVSGGMGSI